MKSLLARKSVLLFASLLFLCATTVAAQVNDDCATPTVAFVGTTPFDSTSATDSGVFMSGVPCGVLGFIDQPYADLWYVFTPPATGFYEVEIVDSGFGAFDTMLVIYGNTLCNNLSAIRCDDDGGSGFLSKINIGLIGGTTYLIRLGSFSTLTIEVPMSMTIGLVAPPIFAEFCFGDGGNQSGCTDCPCGNNSPIGSGAGCLNSSGFGARLIASGDTSLTLPAGSTTDLRFGLTGAPPGAFCILSSGDAVAPGNPANPCFGLSSGSQANAFDGLRCAITNTRRHGGRATDVNGEVGVTNAPWGGEGGPPAGIAIAGGGFSWGQTRYFQAIYRDTTLLVCTRGLNTTQAVEVTFP